ncbi:MAG: hypothetical protein HY390_05685 [Deltaproteobacteria bacterium]|nr:hypothetical protein [Deltaproteobacteria bacterium]
MAEQITTGKAWRSYARHPEVYDEINQLLLEFQRQQIQSQERLLQDLSEHPPQGAHTDIEEGPVPGPEPVVPAAPPAAPLPSPAATPPFPDGGLGGDWG